MNKWEKIFIAVNFGIILFFIFLVLAQCNIDRNVRKLEAVQNEINRSNYERNERMDKELRILSQDVRMCENILLNNDYVEAKQ